MTRSDLAYGQHYLILLTDVLATAEGGRHWPRVLGQVAFLCRGAKTALSDLVWQDHLDDVLDLAQALYSDEHHIAWARDDLTGVEYLRVQLLKTLNGLNTRLAALRSRREEDPLTESACAAA